MSSFTGEKRKILADLLIGNSLCPVQRNFFSFYRKEKMLCKAQLIDDLFDSWSQPRRIDGCAVSKAVTHLAE